MIVFIAAVDATCLPDGISDHAPRLKRSLLILVSDVGHDATLRRVQSVEVQLKPLVDYSQSRFCNTITFLIWPVATFFSTSLWSTFAP